jgi:hypothetical protein
MAFIHPGDPEWTTEAELRMWFPVIVKSAVRKPLSMPDIRFASLELGIHGRYLNARETGRRGLILIATSRRFQGRIAVWDTFVHEVEHHAVFELCCEDASGHGIVFCNVANTMAQRFGYRGSIQPETNAALYWPGSLRRRAA